MFCWNVCIENDASLCVVGCVLTEHRNMLLEDAVAMITQSYAEYCQRRQTKQSSVNSMSVAEPLSRAQPGSTSSSLSLVPEQLRPDTTTRRLIGLLSADCQLTYTELEHVISYLKLRQKVLLRE